MEATLTIDDDLAAQLDNLCRQREASLNEIANEALRQGLKQMAAAGEAFERPFTKPINAGKPLISKLDCIGEILAELDAEKFR